MALAFNHNPLPSQVFSLNEENFFDYVGKDKHVVVDFYTKWCRFCRMMVDEYEALYEKYNGPNPSRQDVLITRIDAADNKKISIMFDIYSFPRIVYFRPKSQTIHSQFEGFRTAFHFSNWIEENYIQYQDENQGEKKMPEAVEEKKETWSTVTVEIKGSEAEAPAAAKPEEQKAELPSPQCEDMEANEYENKIKNVYDLAITFSDRIGEMERVSNEKLKNLTGAVLIRKNNQIAREGINLPDEILGFILGAGLGLGVVLVISSFRGSKENESHRKKKISLN